MKRTLKLAQALFIIMASTQVIASNQIQNTNNQAPIQQITVTNMLWNSNATGGVQGLTPTSVTVAFNNGGAKPCFTTTLAFEGLTNVTVGSGQLCGAAVTSVTITPVAGPAGTVYATPSPASINGSYFATQILLGDGTDPVFDTTNGLVKTQGVVNVTMQGSVKKAN